MPFACIHVPNFLLQAAIRCDESLHDQAVAIFDGIFPLLTVIALNPKAAQKGLHLGMTKTQAELFDVRLLHRSRAQEATAHQALLDCALAISPRVEDTHAPPLKGIGDTVILDTEGLARLYRSPEKIAKKINRLAQQLSLEVNIGIAANLEAAVIAARGFTGITIVPLGCESKSLAPLPINVLPISLELQETFKIWGIHTLQALSALPEVGLVKRLGQEGKRLQDLARGAHQRILVPIEPALKFEESMELESSLELLEPLTFILTRLLKQLCTRLLARSLATNKITLVLGLSEEGEPLFVPPEAVKKSDPTNGSMFPLTPVPSPRWSEGNPPLVPPCTRGDNRGVFDSLALTGGEGGAKRRVRGRHHLPLVQELTEQVTQEQSPLCHSTVLNLPVPTNDSKTLLKLLQLDLESCPPVAPVRSVYLKAEATSPRTAQRELFLPSGPEPEKLEITLARIAAVVGKDRVGSPVLLNTHKPDSFQLKKFLPLTAANVSRNSTENPPYQGGQAPQALGGVPQAECRTQLTGDIPRRLTPASPLDKGESTPRSSLRRFRPPITARVDVKGATPVVVFFRHERRKVLECAGPWRINGDWWTDAQWTREEWDVTLPQQSRRTAQTRPFKIISSQETTVYRIYQDLRTRQWFVEGMYD